MVLKKWNRHWQRKIWQPSYREPMVSIHVPFYKFIFVFATAGSENYRNLKFPHLPDNSTNDSLHAFGALRTFRAGWLWGSCCCAEQERCHATKKGATAHRNSSDDPALRCFWTVFVTSNGKKLSFAEGLQAHCWQTNVYILHSHAAKVAWNSFLPPPKRMNDDELQGENLAKWLWEKGSWRWVLDEIDALQDVSCFLYFYLFIRPWMRWFDHFFD